MGVGPIKSRQWAAEPNPYLWSVVYCCFHFRMVVTLLMASMEKTYLFFCCFWFIIVFTAWKTPETPLTIWHVPHMSIVPYQLWKNVCNMVTLCRFIHNQHFGATKTLNWKRIIQKCSSWKSKMYWLVNPLWCWWTTEGGKKVSLIWGYRCSISHCNLLTLLAIDLK